MTTLEAAGDGGWTAFRQPHDGSPAGPVSTDFVEILDAVGVPIVIVRRDYVIACFNRAAASVLNLAASDIGRSPSAIPMLSGVPSLGTWCAQAISSGTPSQHDLRVTEGSFILRVAPYAKSEGEMSGTVLTFTNVTAFRASIDQAIYEREYTKAILNCVPDPLVVLGAQLEVQTANRAFYSMFSVTRDAIQRVPLNELCERALDIPALVTQLQDTIAHDRVLHSFEVDCELPEIGRRTLLLNGCQFALPGRPVRMALLSFHDITARKQSEERMQILASEVDHRAKNLLALVQAIVHFTQGETPQSVKAAIEGRIQALSNAHTLLAQSRWTGADLRSLVTEEFSPYRGEVGAEIDGPDVILKPRSAQSIAMLLHELTTNAVKYGALSVPTGRVRVAWSRAPEGRLVLRWAETGGPPVTPPERKGFGTGVVIQVVRAELNGEARLDWRPEGFSCEIEFPIVDRAGAISSVT